MPDVKNSDPIGILLIAPDRHRKQCLEIIGTAISLAYRDSIEQLPSVTWLPDEETVTGWNELMTSTVAVVAIGQPIFSHESAELAAGIAESLAILDVLNLKIPDDVPKAFFITDTVKANLEVKFGGLLVAGDSYHQPLLISETVDLFTYSNNQSLEQELTVFFQRLNQHHTGISPDIPEQGAGLQFDLGQSGKIIGFAQTASDGNDCSRIQQLLPMIAECVDDFLAHSQSLANQQPTLLQNAARYRQLISVPIIEIQWAALWATGVRIEAATAAAERKLADRLIPELEDEALSALQSLRNLHGPLILATADGRELQEQSDRIQMTREQQTALRSAGNALASQLQKHDEIIEPETVASVVEATGMIGLQPHPERGTVFGVAAIKNLTIVLFGAAMAALPTLYTPEIAGKIMSTGLWEVIKKIPRFSKALDGLARQEQASDLIGKHLKMSAAIHAAGLRVAIEEFAPFRSFVQLNHHALTEVANTTPQLRWMLPYITYIRRIS